MEVNEVVEPFNDIGIEALEKVVDSALSDGVFKEIPIFKTILALFKTGKGIREYYSLTKIKAFLNGSANLSENDVQEYLSKLNNPKELQEIGHRVLLLVDSADTFEKSELIGKAYVLLIKRKIERKKLFRLSKMINECFYDDLEYLLQFKEESTIITSTNESIPTISLESLFSVGLLSDFGFDGGDTSGKNSGTQFGLNDYGEILKSIL